jgi:NAD(P)-dependent dehydrogenase (short-subunit alcohol dehydrogenase family)
MTDSGSAAGTTGDAGLLGLAGQVCMVTAAGGGIGRAAALQLGRAGCHVAVVDINGATARETSQLLVADGCQSISIEANASRADEMSAAIATVHQQLGALDVAVNVVGGSLIRKSFLDLTWEDWDRVLDLNLRSTVICCQHEAIAMIEDARPGRIINVASSSGITGAPTIAPYGAAKAAVIHLTKSVAMELAPYGLRVNCVVPGTHDSERTRKLATDPEQPLAVHEFWRQAAKAPPLGRLGHPDETAGVVVFLASRLSSYMTGHAVISDGGVVHTTARPPVGGVLSPAALSHIPSKSLAAEP